MQTEMRASYCLGLLLVCALVGGCSRKPTCRGEPEQEELYRMQQQVNDGTEPCPEHLKPKIVLDASGLHLNGERVLRQEGLKVGTHTRISPLFDRLKQNREVWKMLHPGESFDASPTLELAGDADASVGGSVVTTTAFSGYPNQHLVVGGIAMDLRYDVPGPPHPDAPPRVELRLERTAAGYQARYVQGSVVLAGTDAAQSFTTVPRWATAHCPTSQGACADALALQSSGPFSAAVALLKNVLDAFPPAKRPRGVKFF
ncbi:MAG: hypothetical protein R3B13_35245 [Polyangiaceae bacterium]